MRRITILAAALMLSLQAHAATKLKIATINGRDFDNIYVAQNLGIFASHGLDVEITRLPSVASVVPALVSASADISPASMPVILQAVENGIDLVTLCGAARVSKASPTAALIVPTNSPVRSAADLKGKRVAVNAIGAIWQLMLRRWFQTKGVDPANVTFVEVGFPLMRDVLKSGNVDAIASIDPYRGSAMMDGANRVVSEFAVDVNPDVNSGTWNATLDWATNHRAEVKAFVASLEEANRVIRQQPDKAKDALKALYKDAPIEFADVQLRFDASDVQFFNSLLLDAQLLQKPVDPNKLLFAP